MSNNRPEITLILHNIRSTYNVGSVFRTGEGFGVHKIILSGYTPAPKYEGDNRLPHIAEKLHKQIHKTALGAEEMVDFEVFDTFEAWRESDTNMPLIALEQDERSIDIRDFQAPDHFALVLGEEVAGLGKSVLAICDQIVEISMFGKKESFNVSSAAAIIMYHTSIAKKPETKHNR